MTCRICESKTTNIAVPRCKNGPCQACIDVANIENEINQAVATLRRLLDKRCNLRSEQNRVHDTFVHRLPVELKNKIFELLLPSRNEWGAIGAGRSVIMPLYLTSICRAWRDIAWSNPLLWSTIQIGIGKKGSKSDPSRSNFIQEWILRSRTMPLTLHIVVHETKGFEEELKSIIDAISQCSNRWCSLFLDIPGTSNELSAFQHNNFQCHLLKRLQIISRKNWGKEPLPFLNLEVNPEKIEVHGISFRSLQISWNHLSSATVEDFTLEEITQLFQHALQMTFCRIWSPRTGSRDFSMPLITHQRLKSFGLYCKKHASAGVTLLRSLTLPRLKHFKTDEMALLTPGVALVQGPSRSLTCTWKILDDINSDDLQRFPGVTDLVLVFPVIQANVKKLLKHLPDLCHITINVASFIYLWHDTIMPVLLDRNRPDPDVANKGRPLNIFVRDNDWYSKPGLRSLTPGILKDLKSLKLCIVSRENDLMIPGN
jgi:hypothetical protein